MEIRVGKKGRNRVSKFEILITFKNLWCEITEHVS